MGDIASVWNGSGADWQLAAASLADDDGLQTAVVISLFTDRLAQPPDVPPGGARRGWWGDAYAEVQGDLIGSRLWLLEREKETPQTLQRAVEYAREALQWLVDDGVCRAVNVAASVPRPGLLALEVEIVRSAAPAAQYRFEVFWKGN